MEEPKTTGPPSFDGWKETVVYFDHPIYEVPTMTITQMECFVQAASLLNFTAAAERLYMTQPALSHQISNMENELNIKLFVRGNNTVRLTPAGQVLFRGLKGFLEDYKKLIVQVENVSLGITGNFNIGILEDLLLDEGIANAVKKLKARKPGLNIQIQRADMKALEDGLGSGALDVAIVLLSFLRRKDVQVHELASEPLYMAISETASSQLPDTIDFNTFVDVLKEYPLMLISKHDTEVSIRDAVTGPMSELNKRGCYPFWNLINSVEDLALQIGTGVGVIIVNRSHYISSAPGVRLIELAFDEIEKRIWPAFQRGIIYTQKDNTNIRAFIEWMSALS